MSITSVCSGPPSRLGIPGPEAEIVARWRGRALGRFVLTPTPGDPISQERRAVACAPRDGRRGRTRERQTGRLVRGQFRVYLGSAPGVGKTYRMLDEGWRRRDRGTDVVIGYVETHRRPKTDAQVRDLEIVPRVTYDYRGAELRRDGSRGDPRAQARGRPRR